MKPADEQSDQQREYAPTMLLSPDEASKYLKNTHGVRREPVTLRNLRVKGGGPPFQKFGHAVFYTPQELDGWVRQKLSKPLRSTSEAA